MENAADALKLGFFIFIFIVALSVFFVTISQAVSSSDDIVFALDKTNYYPQYEENNNSGIWEMKDRDGNIVMQTDEKGNRVVGIDVIISSIYRSVDETYDVIIRGSDGKIISEFYSSSSRQEDQKKRIDDFMESKFSELKNSSFTEQIFEIIEGFYVENDGESLLSYGQDIPKRKIFMVYTEQ